MSLLFRELIDVESRLCAIEAGWDDFNRGGLVEVLAIPQVYVAEVPSYEYGFDNQATAVLSENIMLLPGVRAYQFRFTTETGGFTENQQEDDNGPYFEQSLVLQVPKDRPEVTWLKQRMKNGRYTFIYRDLNGLVKVLPDMRVKWDLATGTAADNYNGHTLTARRAVANPAINYQLPNPNGSLTDSTEVTTISFDMQVFNFPGGIAPGETVELDHPSISTNGMLVFLNDGLRLRPGMHYTASGRDLRLEFRDEIDGAGPSTILVWNPVGKVSPAITAVSAHTHSIEASYSAGTTFELPQEPVSDDHLLITYNQSFALKPGVDFTRSGTTITLQIDADPLPGDADTFFCIIWQSGAGDPMSINGFNHYSLSTSRIVEDDFIELPSVPITGTLYLRMDYGLLLLEGESYNLANNVISWLEDIEPPDGGLIDLDVWYAY